MLQPHLPSSAPDDAGAGGQALLLTMMAALLTVTLAVCVLIALPGGWTFGVAVGTLLVLAALVAVFTGRFIGPEEH